MANLESGRWAGNVGLRYVRTEVDAQIPLPIPNPRSCQRAEPNQPAIPCAAFPGAISRAGDAPAYFDGVPFNPLAGTMYYKTSTHEVFTNLFSSLNLRYEITSDMIARFDASGCKVDGPNPELEPLISDNIDLARSSYFASDRPCRSACSTPRSMAT